VAPVVKTRGLGDLYVPDSLKTKELLNAFAEREAKYQADPNKLFVKVIGNHDWLMWRQNALLLSGSNTSLYYKDELGTFEKATYGALCGNKEALLPMCKTWHDSLWAALVSAFHASVLKDFVAERGLYEILFTGAFTPVVASVPVSMNFTDLLSKESASVLILDLRTL